MIDYIIQMILAGFALWSIYMLYVIWGIGKTSIWCDNCGKWKTQWHLRECYNPPIPWEELAGKGN